MSLNKLCINCKLNEKYEFVNYICTFNDETGCKCGTYRFDKCLNCMNDINIKLLNNLKKQKQLQEDIDNKKYYYIDSICLYIICLCFVLFLIIIVLNLYNNSF